jgi:outer membrane protein assembly factor BamB
VIYDDTIYAGCLDGKVYALRADTGDKLAEFDLRSPVASSPVVVNGSIIVASEKGVVYTIDTSVNKYKLLIDIKDNIYGPLCAVGDIVYIHTQDLTLHRINVATGAVLRSISLTSKD